MVDVQVGDESLGKVELTSEEFNEKEIILK
jgi:hypothetical protein